MIGTKMQSDKDHDNDRDNDRAAGRPFCQMVWLSKLQDQLIVVQ